MTNQNSKSNNKQVVIIFGPPGAGKGTQSELLSEKLSLYPFETSRILEEKFKEAEKLPADSEKMFIEADNSKYDILEEYRIWKEGKLCSPPFVTYLIKERIRELAELGKSLILSGSPRTLYEAEKIAPLLEELYGRENIKMILLKIVPETTLFRNSNRRICELMRHSILFNKETEKLSVCPLDGSKLVKREGLDSPESIKVRLKEYAERTAPVFEYLKKQGFEIKEVNGEQSVSSVFEDVLKAVNK